MRCLFTFISASKGLIDVPNSSMCLLCCVSRAVSHFVPCLNQEILIIFKKLRYISFYALKNFFLKILFFDKNVPSNQSSKNEKLANTEGVKLPITTRTFNRDFSESRLKVLQQEIDKLLKNSVQWNSIIIYVIFIF
ncbi:hypothetical protein BpHYR1_021401 [Brachionus plicatilis]|uniref:Uncharacterized protein n=1 Tax=Brachionus plicatilis TaxID=10195 RepID=A0A3M7Q049_BRAPC|nr:hypothetical protein BpHYR1_021401 [Brachionus plicatilis]